MLSIFRKTFSVFFLFILYLFFSKTSFAYLDIHHIYETNCIDVYSLHPCESPYFNSEKTNANLYVSSTQKAVDHTPAYAMIITKDNSRLEQVEAGMLYSRLVLTAHSIGFVMQPPSQVLEEYPEMAQQHAAIQAEYAPGGGTIQMFIRLGQPAKNALRTMREDVTELIKN